MPQATKHVQTAWEEVLSHIGPDGRVSRKIALQAFTLAFGPLPGVERPHGPAGIIRDGTGALHWVTSHWSELTPAQRVAINRYLVRHSARRVSIASAAVGDREDGILSLALSQQIYQNMVATSRQEIRQKLGRDIASEPILVFNTTEVFPEGKSALAYASSYESADPSAPLRQCSIWINPSLQHSSLRIQQETIPHEVFHCFQDSLFPNAGALANAAAWLVEGQAEWVGDTLAGHADAGGWFWHAYLGDPRIALFGRSYDALGFYAQMKYVGIDPWSRFDAMLKAGYEGGSAANAAAYKKAFVGPGDLNDFENRWPSSYGRSSYRDPGLSGANWDTNGPGITADMPTPSPVLVDNNTPEDLKPIQPYTNRFIIADLKADLVRVHNGSGYGRISFSDNAEITGAATKDLLLCTRSDDCKPPVGCNHNTEPTVRAAPGRAYVAFSGGENGGSIDISGSALCTPPPKPIGRVDPCSLIDAGTAGILGARFVIGPVPSSVVPGMACMAGGKDYESGGHRVGGGWVLIAVITPDDLRRRASGIAAMCMQAQADTVSKCNRLISQRGQAGASAVKNGVLITAMAIHAGSNQGDLATEQAVVDHALTLLH